MKTYLALLLIGIIHHATPNPVSFVVELPQNPMLYKNIFKLGFLGGSFLQHTVFKRAAPTTPKITSMLIKSNVEMRYATTVVTTEIKNPTAQSKEATFDVILPEDAYITLFTMQVDGREYKAQIKKQAEASRIYKQQISKDKMTALVSLKPRFSNLFVVSTGLSAGKTAIFTLKYEEILPRFNDYYKLSININPNQVVPNFAVNVDIRETEIITDVKVPALKPGNEVDDGYDDEPSTNNNYAKITKSGKKTNVLFNPTEDQQLQLIREFKEKHHIKPTSQNPLVPKREEGMEGQFDVRYRIAAETNKIIVQDGYFVHFFSPANLKTLPKHVIFVLDTSGSMWGEKLEQLKDAMKTILSELSNGDCVSIIHFGSYGYVLTNPTEFSTRSILNIKNQISSLRADGGTNMEAGLKLGFDQIRNSRSKDVRTGRKPMIILLTDGDANIGKSGDQLIQFVKSQNSYQTPIYSLAFGKYADKDFLRKLSFNNQGFMRVIYYGSDANKQLVYFYKQLASPILTNVNFIYPSNQVDTNTVTKNSFDTLQANSQHVVSGKIKQTLNTNSVQVQGMAGKQSVTYNPTLATTPEKWPMERFWAHLKIKTLLMERENNKGVDKTITDLALQYSFVTPLTSLVVITPEKQSTNNVAPLPASMPKATSVRFDGDSDEEEEPFIPENTPPEQPVNVTEEVQIATSKLSKYDLDDFEWLEQFLSNDNDSATLSIARKKRITLLLRPKTETVDFGELQPCSNAIDGGEGKCHYLLDCPNLSVGFKSLQTYKNHYCIINGYAGICCKE